MTRGVITARIETIGSDGQMRVVVERTEVIEVGTMLHDSSRPQIPGPKNYSLEDGTPVNMTSEDTWELYVTTTRAITLKRKVK